MANKTVRHQSLSLIISHRTSPHLNRSVLFSNIINQCAGYKYSTGYRRWICTTLQLRKKHKEEKIRDNEMKNESFQKIVALLPIQTNSRNENVIVINNNGWTLC